MANEDCVELNTGAKMPIIGLGTWQVGCLTLRVARAAGVERHRPLAGHSRCLRGAGRRVLRGLLLMLSCGVGVSALPSLQAPKGEVGAAVKVALESGYKHIDCAACYGNEDEIGTVFNEVFSAGTVKREDVFVTSKLWNSEHAPADVLPAVQKTLADLQLEYLDLYLIHWPQNFAKEGTPGNCSFPRNEDGSIRYDMDTKSIETWTAMEALVEAGLVKAIGLSNFNSVQITEILEKGKIVPANLQVEVRSTAAAGPRAPPATAPLRAASHR